MRVVHDLPDLDLLVVLQALLREQHLTRAARRVGLSQPAMSRALSRLRERFGDPLFARSPKGMTPTPRAEALAPEIDALLESARALLRPAAFHPAALTRTFVVGSVDFLEAEVLPRLAGVFSEEAPKAGISSRPLRADDTADALATGRLDLVVGVRDNVPEGAVVTHLFDDEFVCVVREGHPTVKRKLSLDRFVELSHVLIAPRGEKGGIVDTVLAGLGKSRRVAVQTQTFLAAPLLVAETDLVLTGPRRILVPMAARLGLRLLAPPVQIPGFSIWMGWHPRVQEDPAHVWFRGAVRRAAGR